MSDLEAQLRASLQAWQDARTAELAGLTDQEWIDWQQSASKVRCHGSGDRRYEDQSWVLDIPLNDWKAFHSNPKNFGAYEMAGLFALLPAGHWAREAVKEN